MVEDGALGAILLQEDSWSIVIAQSLLEMAAVGRLVGWVEEIIGKI